MKTFAFIQDSKVHEIITIEDGTPSITDRYHPDFVKCMCDITMLIPMPAVGWLFSWQTGQFAEPLGYDLTPPVAPMVAGNTEAPIVNNTDPRALFDNAIVQ